MRSFLPPPRGLGRNLPARRQPTVAHAASARPQGAGRRRLPATAALASPSPSTTPLPTPRTAFRSPPDPLFSAETRAAPSNATANTSPRAEPPTARSAPAKPAGAASAGTSRAALARTAFWWAWRASMRPGATSKGSASAWDPS